MRASRWEIVGAWLHIWTPPRDVEVPPFPWRLGLLGLAALAALIALFFVLVAPRIDEGNQDRAARDARTLAAKQRAEGARLTRDQRPQSARAARAARLHAARRDAQARAALLAAVRASVGRDVRVRYASGSIDRPVRDIRCRFVGVARPRLHIYCFAVTSRTADALVGQPFVAAGTLGDGRYSWCHENPGPAEGATGTSVQVELSEACTGP
ncbi:MAG: hypothetical protein QOJ89_1695 [bacterium]|jgi:hypothetical protein